MLRAKKRKDRSSPPENPSPPSAPSRQRRKIVRFETHSGDDDDDDDDMEISLSSPASQHEVKPVQHPHEARASQGPLVPSRSQSAPYPSHSGYDAPIPPDPYLSFREYDAPIPLAPQLRPEDPLEAPSRPLAPFNHGRQTWWCCQCGRAQEVTDLEAYPPCSCTALQGREHDRCQYCPYVWRCVVNEFSSANPWLTQRNSGNLSGPTRDDFYRLTASQSRLHPGAGPPIPRFGVVEGEIQLLAYPGQRWI